MCGRGPGVDIAAPARRPGVPSHHQHTKDDETKYRPPDIGRTSPELQAGPSIYKEQCRGQVRVYPPPGVHSIMKVGPNAGVETHEGPKPHTHRSPPHPAQHKNKPPRTKNRTVWLRIISFPRRCWLTHLRVRHLKRHYRTTKQAPRAWRRGRPKVQLHHITWRRGRPD